MESIQGIELGKVGMSFGEVLDEREPTQRVPIALLTVVVAGEGVNAYRRDPVGMLNKIGEMIGEAQAAGQIEPAVVFDGTRDQADGAHQ